MSYLHDILLDEIALEGLNGITLACLWCRLQQREPPFPLALDPKSKAFLWTGIVQQNDVDFYCLPEPRDLPTFPHEYMKVDESTGVVLIDSKFVRKEYPLCIINSTENDGLQGSCPNLKERVNIGDEVRGHAGSEKAMTFEDVRERWGDSLVIVASQELRFRTLTSPEGDPTIQLNDLKYCLLEYIGLHRHHSASQQDVCKVVKINPRSLYHYRKELVRYQLVDKQLCWCEHSNHQTRNSNLLTLTRFAPLTKHINMSRLLHLANQFAEFLEAQPKKTAKSIFLREGLKEKAIVAHCTRETWGKIFNKICQLMQRLNLIEPSYRLNKNGVNVVDTYRLIKKIPSEKDDPLEEETEEIYDPDQSSLFVAELPLQYQIYRLISSMPGLSYKETKKYLRLSRFMPKKLLERSPYLSSELVTMGRQRVQRYYISTERSTDKTAPSLSKTETEEGPREPLSKKALYTTLYLKRRQKILDTIQNDKVLEGNFTFLRQIRADESKEGRKETCDRKSVIRIIDKLDQEELCKKFTTVIMSDDGKDSRTVNFITDVDVSRNDPKVLHIIQQTKFRMSSYIATHPDAKPLSKGSSTNKKAKEKKRKRKVSPIEKILHIDDEDDDDGLLAGAQPQQTSGNSSSTTGKDENKDSCHDNWTTEKRLLRKKTLYGYVQKMERLMVLHTFLWYVVHGMPQHQPEITIKKEIDEDIATTCEIPVQSATTAQHASQSGPPPAQNAFSNPAEPDESQASSVVADMKVETPHRAEELLEGSETATYLLQMIESGECADKVNQSDEAKKADRAPSLAVSSPREVKDDFPVEKHKVYLDVMDWRRFIKPLPHYKDMPKGWCILGDMILSLPLVIFCKVNPLRYMVDGLEELLADPVKRLWLVRDLPGKIRRDLLDGRRFVSHLEALIFQLSSIGLVVFTPCSNAIKEKVYIYVSLNAKIVDTSSSDPAYLYVTDKAYPIIRHHFDTFEDVEKYWFTLKVICLDTPLGTQRQTHDVIVSRDRQRREVLRTVKSHTDPVTDDGFIPGDGRGAAGFDSSLFSHLKRNWFVTPFNPNHAVNERFINRFHERIKKKPGRLNNPLRDSVLLSPLRGTKEPVVVVETRQVNAEEHKAKTVGGKGQKRTKKRTTSEKALALAEKQLAKRRRREERQKAAEDKRLCKEERRLLKEEKRAIGLVSRTKHSWSPVEDSLLLICRVASTILTRNLPNVSSITWETVHQVFVKKCPGDINVEKKDAVVISKRSLRLLKNKDSMTNFYVCLGEIKEDKAIMDSISPLSELQSPELHRQVFEELVNKIHEKFRQDDAVTSTLPDSIHSLRSSYTVVPIAKTDMSDRKFFRLETTTDVNRLVLHSIVLSVMLSQSSSSFDAKAVFKLYENYSSNLLQEVFQFSRVNGVISRAREGLIRQRIVPCVPMSYQLSQKYPRLLNSLALEIYQEARDCMAALINAEPDKSIRVNTNAGACCNQIGLIRTNQVDFKIIIPEHVILLDSNLLDKEYLQKAGLLGRAGDSDSDSDTDDDSDDNEDEEGAGGEDGGKDADGAARFDLAVTTDVASDDRLVFVGSETQTSVEDTGEKIDVNNEEDRSEIKMDDADVMDVLNELASGGASGNFASVYLDHSYSLVGSRVQSPERSVLDRPGVVGPSGDRSAGSSEAHDWPSPSSAVTVFGCGDARLDARTTSTTISAMITSTPANTNINNNTPSKQVEFTTSQYAAEPAAIASPASRLHQQASATPSTNLTMKCLKDNHMSFIKWLIVQRMYTPGVCATKPGTLHDNVIFNAFDVDLKIKAHTTGDDPIFRPYLNLAEYFLRPCTRFTGVESPLPLEHPRDVEYLAELLKPDYIERAQDADQRIIARCHQLSLSAPSTSTVVKVYHYIADSGYLGMSLSALTDLMATGNATSDISLRECLSLLLQQKLILEVGALELRLIATTNSSLWTVCINTPMRIGPLFSDEPQAKRPRPEYRVSPEILDLTEEVSSPEPQEKLGSVGNVSPGSGGIPGSTDVAEVDDAVILVENADRSVEPRPVGMDAGRPSTETVARAVKRKRSTWATSLSESFLSTPGKPLEFLPYPWTMMNGTINKKELYHMIRGIAVLIVTKPGIKESSILDHFKYLFRRMDCVKLLQIMSDLKLISRHSVTLPKPSLFNSQLAEHSQGPVYYYHSSVNCLTKIAMLLDSNQE